MELRLRYNKDTQLQACAALLHGSDPDQWLRQVSRWGIDATQFSCYIIPQSISSIKPGGLFVVFTNPSVLKDIPLLHPYACIGKRLYIPCNAELIPKVTAAELDGLLLWELQVFHPSIGLVGFEKSNQIRPADLFIYPESQDLDWSHAHPGLADRPHLHQVIVTPLSAETIIDDIKTDLGQKPLEEIIPKDKKNPVLEKLVNGLKLLLFVPIAELLKLLESIPGSNTGNYSGNRSDKPGLLQQLQTWFQKNLDELQKKRESEIKRLLNLFDDNTNEALQFAIPLNSPYLNRGSQTSSSSLGRRLTNFNLGGLGGGAVVDNWDVSKYYNDLRTKYLNAAQKEIDQKDFKKAAYVYAHLLGDYHNAAGVLERGNFFREAAALHRDHLKNIPAAAQCLERGGLYSESIELYKELKEDEKVGDLYRLIQQENNALQHFEYCVETKIASDNLLDAARIAHEKMMQEERAKKLLLQGWKGNYQQEPCLKKYFDIVIEKENDDIEKSVEDIYKNHTPGRKHLPFLNILEYVNKKTDSETVLHASQEIAYDILHKEAIKGNRQTLHNLKRFLPGNRLIASDTSRFVSSNAGGHPGSPAKEAMPQYIQLEDSILWKKTTWHRNQFIAVGIKNKRLHMARANWYGNTEYYSWDTEVEDYINLNFISAPYFSDHIILHSSADIPIARRALPKNKYFNEALVVRCPIWLHKSTAQFLIDQQSNVNRLEINNGDMTLHRYSIEGVLIQSVNCLSEDGGFSPGTVYSNPALFFNDGFYYTYSGSQFLTISSTGQVIATNLFTGIRMFTASEYGSDFFLIISTNKGCSLCKPGKGALNFTGEYFAQKLIPLSIVFIGSNRFIIAEKMRAVVFEITDGKPGIIHAVETDAVIAGVLPGSQRNGFAILEQNGKITVHSIGDVN